MLIALGIFIIIKNFIKETIKDFQMWHMAQIAGLDTWNDKYGRTRYTSNGGVETMQDIINRYN